jgi:hypothetical protein
VNSSAPATTTRINPREKATPASRRVGPKPRSEPVPTVVANNAPSAMKAPATIPRTNVVAAPDVAFATPRVRTRSAICSGAKASIPLIGWFGWTDEGATSAGAFVPSALILTPDDASSAVSERTSRHNVRGGPLCGRRCPRTGPPRRKGLASPSRSTRRRSPWPDR